MRHNPKQTDPQKNDDRLIDQDRILKDSWKPRNRRRQPRGTNRVTAKRLEAPYGQPQPAEATTAGQRDP